MGIKHTTVGINQRWYKRSADRKKSTRQGKGPGREKGSGREKGPAGKKDPAGKRAGRKKGPGREKGRQGKNTGRDHVSKLKEQGGTKNPKHTKEARIKGLMHAVSYCNASVPYLKVEITIRQSSANQVPAVPLF